jgi:hypothetical protein
MLEPQDNTLLGFPGTLESGPHVQNQRRDLRSLGNLCVPNCEVGGSSTAQSCPSRRKSLSQRAEPDRATLPGGCCDWERPHPTSPWGSGRPVGGMSQNTQKVPAWEAEPTLRLPQSSCFPSCGSTSASASAKPICLPGTFPRQRWRKDWPGQTGNTLSTHFRPAWCPGEGCERSRQWLCDCRLVPTLSV